MIKYISVSLILLSFSNFALSSATVTSSPDKKELTDRGVNLEAGSKVVLNQYLTDKKAADDSYYSVTIICKHQKNKKSDSCSFSDINYKK